MHDSIANKPLTLHLACPVPNPLHADNPFIFKTVSPSADHFLEPSGSKRRSSHPDAEQGGQQNQFRLFRSILLIIIFFLCTILFGRKQLSTCIMFSAFYDGGFSVRSPTQNSRNSPKMEGFQLSKLTGPARFELATAGVKVLCLTAWRWPMNFLHFSAPDNHTIDFSSWQDLLQDANKSGSFRTGPPIG